MENRIKKNILLTQFLEKPYEFNFNQGLYLTETNNLNIKLKSNSHLNSFSSDFFNNSKNELQLNASAILGRNGTLPLELIHEINKKPILLKIIQILEKRFFLLKYKFAKLKYFSLNTNLEHLIPKLFYSEYLLTLQFQYWFKHHPKIEGLQMILEHLTSQKITIEEFQTMNFEILNIFQFQFQHRLHNKLLGGKTKQLKGVRINIHFTQFHKFLKFIKNENAIKLMKQIVFEYFKYNLYGKYKLHLSFKESKNFKLKNIFLGFFWIGNAVQNELNLN